MRLWFLLLACGGVEDDPMADAIAACDGEPVAKVGGCLVSEAGTPIEVEDTGAATWAGSGTVVEVGVGACEAADRLGQFGPEEAALSWARVDVAGEIWQVGVSVPGWAPAVAPGDTLAIGWDSAMGDILEGRLVLRDGDGALIAWVVNTWFGDEGPPELAIAVEDAATCLGEGDGWQVRRFGLVAGTSVVAPGEAAEVDGWQVHNVDVAEAECFDCDDGAGWWAHYAVTGL